MLDLKRLGKSLKYSLTGLIKVFREEQNFRIHTATTLLVLVLAWYFQIKLIEFIILLMLIGLVLVLEIVNSIFERLLDLIKPRIHAYVEDIKDMAAALVFIGACLSVIIGLLIFLPYLMKLFK
jgi:undecaprenol kinase